jgi:protein tyrosine phosphatase (PTP) superfamily phosphohydrolase (DUF442 family)
MPTPIEAIRGVTNACQAMPNVITGGQPELSHLEALKAAGAAVVLNLRPPAEPIPYDEAAKVQGLGMEYVNVPVGPAYLNDATLERIRTTLRDNRERTVFFHCASANRVGATLIPFLMLDDGMEEEDAIALATRVGLRSPELLQWALDYVKKQRG